MPFDPVDPSIRFPDLEERVLAAWKRDEVFARSVEQRRDAPLWVFYEGPPTANGRPGIHHVESRTFKDVYPRYRAMAGYRVPRKGGWDCHGLPVELEVEKEIGTKSKRDIEAFGIEEFNRRCRASVTRYVDAWEKLTERIGFWVDLESAYWTMDTPYVESVWWSLKGLHERGMLVEADRITTYCPRCGTALSDAETALGYQQVEDPSVYVRFPVRESDRADLIGTSLVGWTTTPWTLISNAGLGVDPDAEYAVVARGGERLIVAATARDRALGEEGEVVATLRGSDLLGSRYEPPYPNIDGAHRVVSADFVTLDDGSGIVHMAPAFGAEDLEVGRREGWKLFRPVDGEGRFTDEAPAFVRGMFFKEADPAVIDDLVARGVMLAAGTIEHTYPMCWRCGTPLIYMARTSWYIRTTEVRDRLLAVNDGVGWYPDHIREGRYGDWLENNVDWALSRERYWGTPLPIWRCAQGHERAVGSLTELSGLAGRDVADIDPHRPAIDGVTFPCGTCGGEARRVPEVIDTWYDSGAMPFAQWGYHPDLGRGIEEFRENFPADFICEAIDQTRGWFYTLMAEGVLHFDAMTYRNVVCLGHLVDTDGRKMSKSLGNVIDPWEVLDAQGADAIRWYLLTGGSPWSSRRVGPEILDEVVRRFLLTIWNVYSFFVTYANASGWEPGAVAPPPASRPALDRWILSRLSSTVAAAREGLDAYDATGAGRAIEALVEDLSNWYVRRGRRRFWDPDGTGGDDSAAAFATLHTCLVTIAGLLAPFTPFLADELWRNLAAHRAGAPDSVHLSDYPTPDPTAADPTLEAAMATARAIVELGRRARLESRIRTRQPLAVATVVGALPDDALRGLIDQVAEELNVREVRFGAAAAVGGSRRAKPDFRALGPRLGPRVKEVAAVLADDDGPLVDALAAGVNVTVQTSGGPVEIAPEDVTIEVSTEQAAGVATDGTLTLTLDLALTADLVAEGLAREVIRAIQDARRSAGLSVGQRIDLALTTDDTVLRDAIGAHAGTVRAEVLATSLVTDAPLAHAEATADVLIEGASLVIGLRPSGA